MRKQSNQIIVSANAAGALLLAAFAQFAAGPAVAGEREQALSLCRGAIAAAFQVSADEAGARFRDSTTSPHVYKMRFQFDAKDGEPRVLTCKVKRGALQVTEIDPPSPAAIESADLATAAGSALETRVR